MGTIGPTFGKITRELILNNFTFLLVFRHQTSRDVLHVTWRTLHVILWVPNCTILAHDLLHVCVHNTTCRSRVFRTEKNISHASCTNECLYPDPLYTCTPLSPKTLLIWHWLSGVLQPPAAQNQRGRSNFFKIVCVRQVAQQLVVYGLSFDVDRDFNPISMNKKL
jgi:hypothetical protein